MLSGQAKGAFFEARIPQSQSIGVRMEDLDSIAVAADERKETARERMVSQVVSHQSGQGIEALSHVGGTGRPVDPHRQRPVQLTQARQLEPLAFPATPAIRASPDPPAHTDGCHDCRGARSRCVGSPRQRPGQDGMWGRRGCVRSAAPNAGALFPLAAYGPRTLRQNGSWGRSPRRPRPARGVVCFMPES